MLKTFFLSAVPYFEIHRELHNILQLSVDTLLPYIFSLANLKQAGNKILFLFLMTLKIVRQANNFFQLHPWCHVFCDNEENYEKKERDFSWNHVGNLEILEDAANTLSFVYIKVFWNQRLYQRLPPACHKLCKLNRKKFVLGMRNIVKEWVSY